MLQKKNIIIISAVMVLSALAVLFINFDRLYSFKNSNLIIITVAPFRSDLLNSRIGDKEITPNINKFAEESVVFPNA